MSETTRRRVPRFALCLIAALSIALMLAAGTELERALADEAVGNPFIAGNSELAGTDDNGTYPLWIGETQVTSENLEGQGWSFNPDTKTLTLNGYSYKGAGHEEKRRLDNADDDYDYYHSPIYWNDPESTLTIELEGENNVVVTGGPVHGDMQDCYYGVFSAGGLTFKGTGGLIADASDIEQPEEDSDTVEPEASGIHASTGVTIEGGPIWATGYDSGIESENGTIAIGANAGAITAKTTGPTNDYPYAIYAQKGDVKIDGGSVMAIGYTGIYTANGIVVNDGEVSAQTNVPDTYAGSIMTPSGIFCKNGQVVVNGGSVNAKGFDYGICSSFFDKKDDEDEDEGEDEGGEDEEAVVNGIVVNGGSVIAEATGPNNGNNTGSGIRVDGRGGGVMAVKAGSVQAAGSGKGGCGISAPGSIAIAEEATSLVATGTGGAFAKDTNVKNAVTGIGWTDVRGTEGKTAIDPSTAGRTLDSYKKALFPTTAAPIITPPTGKELTYNGKPQQLVTAGETDGGEMQYSLDGKTFDAKLPTATDVGEYTIYYKAVGDEIHTDSEVETVKSTIVAKTAGTSKSNAAKTGDSIAYAVIVATVLAALAAAAIAIAAKKRMLD